MKNNTRDGLQPPLAILLAAVFLLVAESARAERFDVLLQSHNAQVSLPIATLEISDEGGAQTYRLEMKEARFGDYFLNMRPFRCMTDQVDMLCHLAYPYAIERKVTPGDLSALEHDFLFIRRKPTDYGIDPWNGLYYRIEKKGDEYRGVAHEVDLNILAVPPERDYPLPLVDAELHETDPAKLWLPYLLIRPVK